MHGEEDLRGMFGRVTEAFEAKSIPVNVHGRIHPAEHEIGGMFVPRRADKEYKGDITVYREHQQIPGDALGELLTLAHECGHANSYLREWSSDAYRRAADKLTAQAVESMCHNERIQVLDEEALAWTLARGVLEEVGFRDWGSYDAEVKRALERYRDELSLSHEEVAISIKKSEDRALSG